MSRHDREPTFSYKGSGGIKKYSPINFGLPLEEVKPVTKERIEELLEVLRNTKPLNPKKIRHL